jgi:hypothetical protein
MGRRSSSSSGCASQPLTFKVAISLIDDAVAVVLLADYISVDAAHKLNALGLGFSIAGLQPAGVTPPMSVALLVELPARYAGEQFSASLELRDVTTDQVVEFASPAGVQEALRVQQLVPVEKPQMPGVLLPSEAPCRVQMVISFTNGLALTPGHSYAWIGQIDGQGRHDWRAQFYVAGPPPGPVLGGPVTPSPTDMPPL